MRCGETVAGLEEGVRGCCSERVDVWRLREAVAGSVRATFVKAGCAARCSAIFECKFVRIFEGVFRRGDGGIVMQRV